ncbi:MAG: hypothetical protein R3194_03965, partial [Limnobacter sp.]|nr:hypothetical protein [Limnobacter sp.]
MSFFIEPQRQAKGRLRAFNAWPVSLHARYSAWYASMALTVVFTVLTLFKGIHFLPLIVLSSFFVWLGFQDRKQTKHSIRRNYPILGHMRFFLEFIRPEIRQYFFESDTDEEPFSRNQRSL